MVLMDEQRIAESLGFAAPLARKADSIAPYFGDGQSRCGIYLLRLDMEIDPYYVGQSVDVVRRYREHTHTMPPILAVWFQPIPHEQLDGAERQAVYQAEALGVALYNKALVSVTVASGPLDDVMTPDQQQHWLDDPASYANPTRRNREPIQVQRFANRVEQLRQRPDFQPMMVLVSDYVCQCLPAYAATEALFWSLSCLPSTNGGERLVVVNVHMMETLVLIRGQGDTVRGFINLSQSVYRRMGWWRRRRYRARVYHGDYESAGTDQLQLHFDGLDDLQGLLVDAAILRAARDLNLRLMRKGTSRHARYHCYALADWVMADE